MILLAEATIEERVATALNRPAVISTLDGVTTALVAFVLVGLVMPQIIRKRREFYAIVWMVIGVILLHTLTVMIQSAGFTVFAGAITGLLQAVGFGLAVMSTGGLAARELGGELLKSYEVMRRGSEAKEVIIPLEGQQPRKKQDESESVIYTIDTPPADSGPPGPAKPPPPTTGSLPME